MDDFIQAIPGQRDGILCYRCTWEELDRKTGRNMTVSRNVSIPAKTLIVGERHAVLFALRKAGYNGLAIKVRYRQIANRALVLDQTHGRDVRNVLDNWRAKVAA